MEVSEQLLSFVRESLAQGRSEAQISNDLLAKGWEPGVVKAAFIAVNPPALEVPLPPAPPAPEAKPAFVDHEWEQEMQSEQPSAGSQAVSEPAAVRVEHRAAAPDIADQHKGIVRAIVTTGAILLGIGVYYFLAVHWQELAEVLRLAIIILSILASFSAGWYLRERAGLTKIGTALILLGTIMYGGGIFLVAQMYGIYGHLADGWGLWAFGAALVALSTRIFSMHYLTLFLVLFAGAFYIDKLDTAVGHDPSLVTSTFMLLLLVVVFGYTALDMRRGLKPEASETF